jgi:hypothetical protein
MRSSALPLVLLTFLAGCGISGSQKNIPRVIVLGVDSMDPQFVQQHWSALPHLDRRRRQAPSKPLKTSTPPQSPWPGPRLLPAWIPTPTAFTISFTAIPKPICRFHR